MVVRVRAGWESVVATCREQWDSAAALLEEEYAVTGLDFSPAMVAGARAKAPTGDFVVGDAATPPLLLGGFDAVLSRHVLWGGPVCDERYLLVSRR